MMLSAAAVTDNTVRDLLVGQVRDYFASKSNNAAISAYYNSALGAISGNFSETYNSIGVNSYVPTYLSLQNYWPRPFRPTIGSVFSLLVKGYVKKNQTV